MKKTNILNKILISISGLIILSIMIYSGIMIYHVFTPISVPPTISSDTEVPPPSPSLSPLQELVKPYSPKTDPINILVVGGDQSSGNSDTIILINYNPKTCDISMLSIPRDTSVSIEGRLRKINFAYPTGGIKRTCKMVSQLLDVNIDYHCYVDTSIFREVIDLLGGVRYYVPTDIKYTDRKQNLYIDLKKGWQTLNGQKAEQLVRFRKPNKGNYTSELLRYYDGGDLKRIDAQQEFIKQLIDQKATMRYINKLTPLLKSIFKKVKTNMTIKEATILLYNAKKIDAKKIKSYRLYGKSKTVDAWYYFYRNKIYSNKTKKTYDAKKLINNKFTSYGLYLKNNPLKSKQFRDTIKTYYKTGKIYAKK